MRTFLIATLSLASFAMAQHGFPAPAGKPDAIVDLRTDDGVKLIHGQWRYSDAKIVEVNHHSVGPDLKATGPADRTNDISPKAGAADFDDSTWEKIPASSMENRRGNGKLTFNWYRINVTIPEKIGDADTTGGSVVFETTIDDYAEVWVNGKLPRVLGQVGGSMAAGWNAPNRILLTRNAKPGEQFQIAVFGINAPLSDPPATFIWAKSATLDFYKPGRDNPGVEIAAEVVRVDPAIDRIIPSTLKVEKIAEAFGFTEGPVWVPGVDGNDGYLLFSDPNNNTIYRWATDGNVSVYRAKSGYTGVDIGEHHQPGSNGLTLDLAGRLTIDEHGNRRVTRLEKNGVVTVLADRFEGKRLNSPNDLVYRSDGTLFFTDPPFGLPKAFDDARKELPFSGVFMLKDGQPLKLASQDLAAPNGLAFSPDEQHLYVDNWETNKKVVMRYDVAGDGSLANGSVFFDVTAVPGEIALDGLKVDTQGNVYVSGPGGVWIISSAGKHLGTIKLPNLPANFTFGEDGKTLFLCARSDVYRMRVNVPGTHPIPRP